MTAWTQSRDFGEMRERSRKYFKWGTRAFYYCRGKWVHGEQFKWPAMRFAGLPDKKLNKHLYLDWGAENEVPIEQPRLISKHRKQSLEELRKINDEQPFSIYGTSRTEESVEPSPLRIVNGAAVNADNGYARATPESVPADQPLAGD